MGEWLFKSKKTTILEYGFRRWKTKKYNDIFLNFTRCGDEYEKNFKQFNSYYFLSISNEKILLECSW